MKTHALTIKIGAKKPKNVRNCERPASIAHLLLDCEWFGICQPGDHVCELALKLSKLGRYRW